MAHPADLLRFKSFTKVDGDCLVWTGYILPNGYGQFWINGGHFLAHRAAWFLHYGEWPAKTVGNVNYDLNHTCENKSCVKIDHLEHISKSDHAVFTAKSHQRKCPEGHDKEFEPYNGKHGRWTCKICKLDSQRKIRNATD